MGDGTSSDVIPFLEALTLDRLEVLCGVPSVAHMASLALAELGLLASPSAEVKLILDFPMSHAMRVLEGTSAHGRQRTIVATRNPCPEHAEDLWELGARALVMIDLALAEPMGRVLVELRERMAAGERYRLTPVFQSPLNSTERAVLRYTARGWEQRRIAEELRVGEQSVRNAASRVHFKLGLSNPAQLALYYWGLGPRF